MKDFGYEYLDHPADVQLHAWGSDIKEAMEQVVIAMFGYMTDIETVEELDTDEVVAEGHDLESLLFSFLNEWLYKFSAEPFFVPRYVRIMEMRSTENESWFVRSKGIGETFQLGKHPQGTEVKAITYSCMKITQRERFAEVFVIIDI